MSRKQITLIGLISILSARMSTAPQFGTDASAWGNYLSW